MEKRAAICTHRVLIHGYHSSTASKEKKCIQYLWRCYRKMLFSEHACSEIIKGNSFIPMMFSISSAPHDIPWVGIYHSKAVLKHLLPKQSRGSQYMGFMKPEVSTEANKNNSSRTIIVCFFPSPKLRLAHISAHFLCLLLNIEVEEKNSSINWMKPKASL